MSVNIKWIHWNNYDLNHLGMSGKKNMKKYSKTKRAKKLAIFIFISFFAFFSFVALLHTQLILSHHYSNRFKCQLMFFSREKEREITEPLTKNEKEKLNKCTHYFHQHNAYENVNCFAWSDLINFSRKQKIKLAKQNKAWLVNVRVKEKVVVQFIFEYWHTKKKLFI